MLKQVVTRPDLSVLLLVVLLILALIPSTLNIVGKNTEDKENEKTFVRGSSNC